MKKFSRIFLALVLSLSLLTGSIGIPVFAEEGGTEVPELVTAPEGELPEETDGALNAAAGLSTSVPERDYYPINHTNPLNYVADTGLRNYLLGFRNRDSGHMLENIVYFELLRRGYDVAIGKVDTEEVDFVASLQRCPNLSPFMSSLKMRVRPTSP